jgi:hypothetical protein
MLGVLCIVAFAIEAFAFLFLLFRDRDALRSERFAIAKMSIEKGVYGDTLSGFVEVASGDPPKALPASTSASDKS